MNVKVFSIFDSKLGSYGAPYFALATGGAIRQFMDVVNDNQSLISRYPADFTLFEVGKWDDKEGRFENLEVKENLGNAVQFKKEPAVVSPARFLPELDGKRADVEVR